MLGIDVTVLDILTTPLERVLGGEVGALYAEMHRSHGVRLRLGEGIAAFQGTDRVETVETTSGERFACSTVVVGIGVRPATEWLDGSGLALENGILVNAQCETSIPGIFAIGDAARWPYHRPGTDDVELVRLEHWDNALRQGDIAAQNALGRGLAFSSVPYFWSDQYGLRLQYVGYATSWDEVVIRGNPAAESYIAFYLSGEVVQAAFAVNRVRDLVALKRLIGQRPDRRALADDAVPLKSLMSSSPAR
jgi:3-phenylpropionate/trans-cinnamate dioxygenase ferredoxin reductase subunit